MGFNAGSDTSYDRVMLFDRVGIEAARGAILAHSVRADERLFRKGHVLSEADIDSLKRAGVNHVVVARLEPDDIGEDHAAARIALPLAGCGVRIGAAFTGRANLYAEARGILCIDADAVGRINAVDEAITLATLPPFSRVEPRQMLATIKIIPFAAPKQAIHAIERLIGSKPIIGVSAFATKSVALISTFLKDTRPQLLGKNANAVSARIEALGSRLIMDQRVPHEDGALASAIEGALAVGADPILIFGASAITDRRDVVPSAILRVGGRIDRFGMPVDPGNLLLLGHARGSTIIGLPGCARSPKRNGFDFVLERVLADIAISSTDIAAMGVGGLLAEIQTRPQPREAPFAVAPRAPDVAAIVLAAGQSRRMGYNKLTAELAGAPLVRHVAKAAIASQASTVLVVTGSGSDGVEAALGHLPVTLVHNPDFRLGLSTSLNAGIRKIPENCDAVVILLGDMPGISAGMIDKLIAAFNPEEGRAICVASHGGKRGNPVLWSRRFFPEMQSLKGDVGAKQLIVANEELVCDVEIGSDAPLVDIDTPDTLRAFAARLT